MAKVTPIRQPGQRRPRKAGPQQEHAAGSFQFSIRIPADHWRHMTQIVESPDYTDYTTKADIVIAAIDHFLQHFYEEHPDAPGRTSFDLARNRALRNQRDEEYRFADTEFQSFYSERDLPGMQRLLVHTLRLKMTFQQEGASPVEMKNVDGLVERVKSTLSDWSR
jgi:hypothetical protein